MAFKICCPILWRNLSFDLLSRWYTTEPPKKSVKSLLSELLGIMNTETPVLPSEEKPEEARFIMYHNKDADKSQSTVACTIGDWKKIFFHCRYNTNKRTILYVPGYMEFPDSESVCVMADTYVRRTDYNFILLDWSSMAGGSYIFNAAPNVDRLAPQVAHILLDVFKMRMDVCQLHVIGFSLGAHLAGIIGREVFKQSKKRYKIPRVSALDPAYPQYYWSSCVKTLNPRDASFVDVIHGDDFIPGYPSGMGHAEFWPNNGRMPARAYPHLMGEDLENCNKRAWYYWAESVCPLYDHHLLGVKAKDWCDFKDGKFCENHTALMGAKCPFGITGNYYLQTNCLPPYGRGKLGLKYIEPMVLLESECRPTV